MLPGLLLGLWSSPAGVAGLYVGVQVAKNRQARGGHAEPAPLLSSEASFTAPSERRFGAFQRSCHAILGSPLRSNEIEMAPGYGALRSTKMAFRTPPRCENGYVRNLSE